MNKVSVNASGSYEVLIGAGLLDEAGQLIRPLNKKCEKVAIVTDDTVNALYAARLETSLANAGFKTCKFVLEHGEQSKNGENYLKILNFLAENQMTRGDMLAALGGGMVGDIGAFSASTYLRGIDYVQIPTTLLADVDSSVGGKTAIDLPAGKNLAGAFCQPKMVICDHSTLGSLSRDIFTDGCAEVIKYGILADEELFAHLEEKKQDFDLEKVVTRCVEIKRDYVCADEFDTGLRRMLNLGHTYGHAVEADSDFALSHGKSVAIGTATVARAAAKRGWCSEDCAQRICRVLEAFGLPIYSDGDYERQFPHMLSDKKRVGSVMNVIVPEKIGSCRVVGMTAEELKQFMNEGRR